MVNDAQPRLQDVAGKELGSGYASGSRSSATRRVAKLDSGLHSANQKSLTKEW